MSIWQTAKFITFANCFGGGALDNLKLMNDGRIAHGK